MAKFIADEDLLAVVGCEIEKRPDAPTIADLAPLLTRTERSDGALTMLFPASAAATVEAFAAAEQHCCAGIGWDVRRGDVTTLRITANEVALDALAQMLQSIHIDDIR